MSIVVFYGAYYVFKKWRAGEDVAFLRPGNFPNIFLHNSIKIRIYTICIRILKTFCEIFLGPMLSPKGFGPRADSGLPIAGQANDGYNENA